MGPKSKSLKPRIGRPPLAPGERRDRQLNLLVRVEERRALIEEANKAGRTVSEQVMRYLHTMREHADIWDDLAELRQARVTTALRILSKNGWLHCNIGERGEMLLSPRPPGAPPFVEVAPGLVVSSDIDRIVHAVLAAYGLENHELIAQAFFKALKGRVPKQQQGAA